MKINAFNYAHVNALFYRERDQISADMELARKNKIPLTFYRVVASSREVARVFVKETPPPSRRPDLLLQQSSQSISANSKWRMHENGIFSTEVLGKFFCFSQSILTVLATCMLHLRPSGVQRSDLSFLEYGDACDCQARRQEHCRRLKGKQERCTHVRRRDPRAKPRVCAKYSPGECDSRIRLFRKRVNIGT